MDPGGSDWRGWRYVIAGAVVVILGFTLWLFSGSKGTPAQSASAADPLERSLQQYQAGRFEDAIVSAKAALAANANLPEAYNNLAVSYLGLHQYDEGIRAAQEALRLRPDFPLAINNLAWIQREKAKASGAPVPDVPLSAADTLLNQSLASYKAGRYQDCIDTATRSARLAPGSAGAFSNIGICAARLKKWDEAIRNLQEAIRLDPNLQIARNNLVWTQQERLKSSGKR